ncbi:MAG: hypothetical protein U0136_18660 [Bdellovibrionota bacterium]
MRSLLRHFVSAIRYPESHAQGFVAMGKGIAERRKKFSAEWNQHLELTRRAQARWLDGEGDTPLSRIVVLGAGRLFDVDQDLLASRFREIAFYDADPLCLPAWRTFSARYPKVQTSFHIMELSGALRPWESTFRAKASTSAFDESVAVLRTLTLPERSPFLCSLEHTHPAAVLSLNILSQLVVMWQNLVERILIENYGASYVAEHEQQWLEAYAPSARLLIRQHLQDLGRSEAKKILLISDVEYLHYPQLPRGEHAIPFLWEEQPAASGLAQGTWRENPECSQAQSLEWRQSCELTSALLDVNVENEKLRFTLLPEYQSELEPCWLWLIAPESAAGEAVLHRVRPIQFKRSV